MLSTKTILSLRGQKNQVDPLRPYAWLHESELQASGQLESFATLFLTNAECPLRCLMCDLWKNTLDTIVPAGAIATQIEYGLQQLPPAESIKLYNSGNFFDSRAIPLGEHPRIAQLVAGYRRVVVENHPRLVGPRCLEFQQSIEPQLEIAMGLETIHPEVLPRLNKQMTLQEFSTAAQFLRSNQIDLRVFVLLQPPGLFDAQAIEWAVKSVEYAFTQGATCCSIIPVRQGNGALERLAAEGLFREPTLVAIEQALELSLQLDLGRVFIDLWDAPRFASCAVCSAARIERLQRINLSQQPLPHVECQACESTIYPQIDGYYLT